MRLIASAIEVKNLDLANYYASAFKKLFDQKAIDTYKEYFVLLENANKQAEAENEKKSDNLFKKIQKNKKQAEAHSNVDPAIAKSTEKPLNLSSETNESDLTSSNKTVSKSSKNKWIKWMFGPALLFGAATGLYFLLKNRNHFRA